MHGEPADVAPAEEPSADAEEVRAFHRAKERATRAPAGGAAVIHGDDHKFSGIPWTPGRHGSPILDGVSGHIEVLTERRISAFTHTGGTFSNGAALEGAVEDG